MTEDPTLTDFLEVRSGDESPERDGNGSAEPSSAKRTAAGGEAEGGCEDENETEADGENDGIVAETDPAVTTYAWGSYVCAVCDTSVERVWQRGDGDGEMDGRANDLVCESCKTW